MNDLKNIPPSVQDIVNEMIEMAGKDGIQLENKEASQSINIPAPTAPKISNHQPNDTVTTSLKGKNLIPRSAEVHEILSHVPNWMILWGNTFIFLILMGILYMSYLIKYPDVVAGTITLNSAHPPVPLVAKNAATLQLLKKDKEVVMEDDIIGILNSETNFDDVLLLKLELENFEYDLENNLINAEYELPEDLQLGILQSSYSQLFLKLKEHKIQQRLVGTNNLRKGNIDEQLRELIAIQKAQEKSISLKYQEYIKAKGLLENRYKQLFKTNSISAEQLDIRESEVNRLLDVYQNDLVRFKETKKRILDLKQSKSELDFQRQDQEIRNTSTLIAALSNLKSRILIWEQNHLLKASITGMLNFNPYIKDKTYVQRDQEIAKIVPEIQNIGSAMVVGEMLFPAVGAGKVAKGQVVNVELFDYPKKEFGVVEGMVVSISNYSTQVSNNTEANYYYRAAIHFPEGFKNTMEKDIQFKHNMSGRAEIITADIRLIQRFFYELRSLFGNS